MTKRRFGVSLYLPLALLALFPGNLVRGQSSTTPPPDCIFFVNASLTAGSPATISYPVNTVSGITGFDNRTLACQTWTISYVATATSGTITTLDFQAATGAVSPGSYSTWGGTVATGINPNTSSVQGTTTFSTGCAASSECNVVDGWVKILLTRNNFVGHIQGVVYGYRTGYAHGGGGGGGGPSAPTIQANMVKCFDSDATHDGSAMHPFICNTSPSFTPGDGTVVWFSFAASANVGGEINVNGLGNKFIIDPFQDNVGSGYLAGVADGSRPYYPLAYDATEGFWIVPGPPSFAVGGAQNMTDANNVVCSNGDSSTIIECMSGAIVNAALQDGSTAVTQSPGDNTAKVATDAFVQSAIGVSQLHSITFAINGGGSVISTGDVHEYITVDFNCTISRVDISGNPSGSMTVDIWKVNAAIPTGTNKISASAPATLSSSQLAQSGSLSGWSTSVVANDVFDANVATVSSVTSATVQLWCQ
jgi:hypothetical protein